MPRLETFLAGVKVLDLSQYIPGPMASLLLADMGAEVLKIEPPQGDEMRNLGPRDAQGRPLFYNALNAGKSVLRLDLKQREVREAFLGHVATADVLIEGFRPGVMARLGLGYATLSAINPRLVYCSISGYGATGSHALKAAHDGNYLATSGALDRNGEDAPMFFDPPVADTSGSLFAVIAILGALHGRAKSGRGCQIDLGLADVVMPLQLLQVAEWAANGTIPKPRSSYLNGGAAYYQVYATADSRHIMLGCVEAKFWRNFCVAANRPDWLERQPETMPQTALIADLASFFAGISLEQASALFSHIDCCFSPVLDLGEALTSEQVRARGLVRPGPEAGEMQALFPAIIDGQAPRLRQKLVAMQQAPPSDLPAATTEILNP